MASQLSKKKKDVSAASTLSSKSQVTVPVAIRKKLGAESGDQIVFAVNENDEVIVKVKKKNSLLSLFGSLPPKKDAEPLECDEIRKQAQEELSDSRNS